MRVRLFRSRFSSEILCAVPFDEDPPEFLAEAGWRMIGSRPADRFSALTLPDNQRALGTIGHVIFPL
ncbi:hypothetical protein [Enterovirga sp.]|uniref:hypothetical protein n=1 Tax=Enterovirga sp. TaxID=2026350 RepID=UPI002BF18A16|nr:hypothetical protein [Enterovirga sp.]HMO28372.1 hypothetical protein [Enterovirga sp.]